jgi:uncharacterized protein (DUF2141 family)
MWAFVFSLMVIMNSTSWSQKSTDRLGVLVIEVTNIERAEGYMRIGLYNQAAGFPNSGKVFTGKIEPVNQKGRMRIEIPDLPMGSYAIGVHHDLKGHHKMPTNLFGVPIDPYGFSNDARAKWRAPRFEESRIDFSRSGQIVPIEIRFWDAW